jgi:hypothetical protein
MEIGRVYMPMWDWQTTIALTIELPIDCVENVYDTVARLRHIDGINFARPHFIAFYN